MSKVQLNAVKAGFASTSCRVREQCWQLFWKIPAMLQMSVGYALACAEFQRVQLAGVQYTDELLRRQRKKPLTDFPIGRFGDAVGLAVSLGNLQEFTDEAGWNWAAPDRQEIDELNEQSGLS